MKNIKFLILFWLAFTNQIFAQTVTVSVIFNESPAQADIQPAALRFNKDFAYSFTFDDGKEDAYTHAYPLYTGGSIDGVSYPGLFYTDGCGNSFPFKGGIAWTSKSQNGDDSHENVPFNMKWHQLVYLYEQGWNIFNHSLDHSYGPGTDYDFQVKENLRYVKQKTGIVMKQFVIPTGDQEYTSYAFANGMRAVYNQSGFPGVGGLKVDGNLNLHRFTMHRHFLSDSRFDANTMKNNLDAVAAKSSATNHYWCSEFTHRITDATKLGGMGFNSFSGYMNYIESTYGRSGKDNVWMAPLQEVYEYLVVREKLILSYQLKDNILELVLDFSDIEKDLDKYAISFVVHSDKDIREVQVLGTSFLSFKGTGADKLINLEWSGYPEGQYLGSVAPEKPKNLLIYPNPARDQILIVAPFMVNDPSTVEIFDAKGRKVRDVNISLEGSQIRVMLPSSLKSGIYFISVLSDTGEVLKEKFRIQ